MSLLVPFLALMFGVWICIGRKTIPGSGFWLERLVFFLLPFQIGLHIDLVTGAFGISNITLSAKGDFTGVATVAALVVSILIAVIMVCYILRLRFLDGSLYNYALGYTVAVAVLGLITVVVTPPMGIHFHHYMLSLAILPACRGITNGRPRGRLTLLVVAGFALGWLVNAGAMWGLASLWVNTQGQTVTYNVAPEDSNFPFVQNVTHMEAMDGTRVTLEWDTKSWNDKIVYHIYLNSFLWNVTDADESSLLVVEIVPDIPYTFLVCPYNQAHEEEGATNQCATLEVTTTDESTT